MAEKKRKKISKKRLKEILAGKGLDPISLGIEEDKTGSLEKGSSKKDEKKKTRKELIEEILADGVRGPIEGLLGPIEGLGAYGPFKEGYQDPETIFPSTIMPKKSKKQGGGPVYRKKGSSKKGEKKKLISGGRTAAERRTDKLQSAARSKVMKASHGGAVVAARHNRASSGPVSRGAGATVKGIKFKGVR